MVFDARLGIVVIGRNEGQRLRHCLESLGAAIDSCVYVDSGSKDGSLDLARELGADCIELEPPFSAAKARNQGLARLLAIHPEIEFVQFIDGDSDLAPGWLQAGSAALDQDPSLVVVCGALRERHPEASIYNRLCALEWRRPPGEIEACGGITMMRVDAFQAQQGFDQSLVAGEEPELCLRLRRAGGKLRRLPDEMAIHDAAMTRLAQWWRRSLRSGYALAAGAARHRHGPERYCIRETRSNWFWGLGLPATTLLSLPWLGFWGLALPLAYPILFLRIASRQRRAGLSRADAGLYASFCVLGKLPEAFGQCIHFFNGIRRKRTMVFDYKPPVESS